jgi:hypothetical protein
MTQTGSMGLISADPQGRGGTPGRNSKIVGYLAPFSKAGSGPPMPQQASADKPDDQNHADQLLRSSVERKNALSESTDRRSHTGIITPVWMVGRQGLNLHPPRS